MWSAGLLFEDTSEIVVVLVHSLCKCAQVESCLKGLLELSVAVKLSAEVESCLKELLKRSCSA